MITLSIILLTLIVLYILKYRYTSKIRNERDNIDFTTDEGKERIKELNRKLDIANGYRLFNSK